MSSFSGSKSQNAEVAATLTMLELPNLFALLDLVQRAGDAEATIDLATSLYEMLQLPASHDSWNELDRFATLRRRRWETPGITRNSKRREPELSSSLLVDIT